MEALVDDAEVEDCHGMGVRVIDNNVEAGLLFRRVEPVKAEGSRVRDFLASCDCIGLSPLSLVLGSQSTVQVHPINVILQSTKYLSTFSHLVFSSSITDFRR